MKLSKDTLSDVLYNDVSHFYNNIYTKFLAVFLKVDSSLEFNEKHDFYDYLIKWLQIAVNCVRKFWEYLQTTIFKSWWFDSVSDQSKPPASTSSPILLEK